jgi:hypothetical protein
MVLLFGRIHTYFPLGTRAAFSQDEHDPQLLPIPHYFDRAVSLSSSRTRYSYRQYSTNCIIMSRGPSVGR